MRSAWLAVIIFSITAIGCSSRQIVHVVDPSGKPIQGVNITAVTLSAGSRPNITDANGNAELPFTVQATKWVQASKAGYDSDQIDIPTKWPVQITLQPSSGPSRSLSNGVDVQAAINSTSHPSNPTSVQPATRP